MTMEDKKGVIWFNGKLVPWADAKIHVLTHTLHYGMGVFEGIRAYETSSGTALFRLTNHVERFFQSAHILRMSIPYSKDEILEAAKASIRENKLKAGYVRPLCFFGAEGMGLRADNLKVHIMVAAWEWGAYLGAENLERGIRVGVSSITRHHVNSMMCRAKACGGYINSMLAVQEALACGFDEALLLDAQGFVAEGPGENFFVVKKGVLYTPELASVLPGITRDTVISITKKAGIPVREKRITRDEIYIADEAFFTGTAAEVTPIREVDGRVIGSGRRGELTTFLQDQYFKIVRGQETIYSDWLSYV